MKTLSIGKPQKKEKTETIKQTQNTIKAEKGKAVDLNFKVEPEFKRDFKIYAANHDMSQKQVLEIAFKLLKESTV